MQQFQNNLANEIKEGVNGCEICEEIVEYVAYVVENQDVQAEIVAYITNAIKDLPQREQKIILDLYNQYLAVLEEVLNNPTALCTNLGACPATNQTILEFISLPKPTTNAFCSPCQADMNVLANKIKAMTNQGDAQVLNKLWPDLCGQLSPQYQGVCMNFVQGYGSAMTQKMTNFLNKPEMTCNTVGLCNKNLPAVSAVDKCIALTIQLNQVQSTYNVQPEMLRMSASACEMLPQTFADVCRRNVATPLLQTAEILENKLAYCELAVQSAGKYGHVATAVVNEAIGVAAKQLQQLQASRQTNEENFIA